MKLSLFKIALAITLILTTTATAQETGMSFNFFGGGARSEGMGQAFLAVSNDGTAGSWNPAGLQVQEKTLMSFNYDFFLPRGEYDFNISPSRINKYDHSGSFKGINCWTLVSPMRIKNHHFVVNLSYTKNFDTYFRFGERIRIDSGAPNALLEKHGAASSINLAFGTRIYKQLSFGFSGNIHIGKMVTDENRVILRDTTFAFGTYQTQSDVRVMDSSSLSGFSGTFGFLYEAEKLRTGLVIRTPFTLKGSTDSTIYRITTLNGVDIKNLTDTAYIGDRGFKIEIPLIIGLGLAYDATENLLLSGDFEYRAFKGKKVQTLDSVAIKGGGDKVELYTIRDPFWKNVIQCRIGAEYTLNTPIGRVPVRCGYRNEEFPGGDITSYEIRYEGKKGTSGNDSSRVSYIYDYDTSGLNKSNRITGHSLSFGFGVHWTQIMVDIAYTYTTYRQDIYAEQDGKVTSTNSWKNHHLNFGFTGYF